MVGPEHGEAPETAGEGAAEQARQGEALGDVSGDAAREPQQQQAAEETVSDDTASHVGNSFRRYRFRDERLQAFDNGVAEHFEGSVNRPDEGEKDSRAVEPP